MKKTIQKIKNTIKSKYVKKSDFEKVQTQLIALEETVAMLVISADQSIKAEQEATAKVSPVKKKSKPEPKKPVKSSSVTKQSKPVKKVPVSTSDNLKKIKGIGSVLEEKLKAVDITRIAQIASWDKADIEKISSNLNFKGRIERDEWVNQAKALMAEQG